MNIKIQELTKMVDSLPDTYRTPFLMAYQGYQYDEISDAMGGLPMGTVKSRIHLARKQLKQQIGQLYGETATVL